VSDKISSIGLERAKKLDDNREWNLRDMCEYIVQEIDKGDTDLANAKHALLIYETDKDEDASSYIWHVAMKCNFSDRLELCNWHLHFLMKEWTS
jgi:hypothetical protein